MSTKQSVYICQREQAPFSIGPERYRLVPQCAGVLREPLGAAAHIEHFCTLPAGHDGAHQNGRRRWN